MRCNRDPCRTWLQGTRRRPPHSTCWRGPLLPLVTVAVGARPVSVLVRTHSPSMICWTSHTLSCSGRCHQIHCGARCAGVMSFNRCRPRHKVVGSSTSALLLLSSNAYISRFAAALVERSKKRVCRGHDLCRLLAGFAAVNESEAGCQHSEAAESSSRKTASSVFSFCWSQVYSAGARDETASAFLRRTHRPGWSGHISQRFVTNRHGSSDPP